jgi:hypothetical protein
MLLQESLLVTRVKRVANKPTVGLDVTSLVVNSSGYNSGPIEQHVAHELAMHWATYGGLLHVQNIACAAHAARSARAVTARPASTADSKGLHQ